MKLFDIDARLAACVKLNDTQAVDTETGEVIDLEAIAALEMERGEKLENVSVTDDNIKSFDRIARKYGIDYSLKKDSSEDPPKYFIFFKAKDGKVMNAAFSEYTRNMINRNEKSSIREKLRSVGEQVKTKVQERTREKSKSREVEL